MLRAQRASSLVLLLAATSACGQERTAGAALAPPSTIRALPAAPPWDPALQHELARALRERGADHSPRSRHLEPDGSPRYTNRLILESSPYLLQHAHNPVNWFPWGDAAFEEAARSGRPVLLSIGYSTCHWCHVMEEESFEDEAIAAVINSKYVAIKVDREERPEIDSVYMNAVQILSGRGGWPMTAWLTPAREPFYGGTYFPARDGDRPGQTGFLTLLERLEAAYREDPQQVAQTTEEIKRRLERELSLGRGAVPTLAAVDAAIGSWRSIFDASHGGVAGAPKFPSTLPVRLLLRYHARTGDESAKRMALVTLERMAAGGIHDQIGGGFHRYATDAAWLVPHFEKMLYDNALLARAYVEAGQSTGDRAFFEVARGTLDYVLREMTSPEGAFYSATDADSADESGRREEGRYFTWTAAEIRAVLSAEDARLVELRYGVTTPGAFEGRNVLHVSRSEADVARELGLTPASYAERSRAAREALLLARAKRPRPARDEKIIAAWNGLAISAMAHAGFALDEPRFVSAAEAAARFVSREMVREGRLHRVHKDGRASRDACLDDYAFVIAGLLDLYETTGGARWLETAIELEARLDAGYADVDGGGYFITSHDHERLLVREKPVYDGAEPSGNSVALSNLLRLEELTGVSRYRVSAERLLEAFAALVRERPTTVAEMLIALDFRGSKPREVAVVSPTGGRTAEPFLRVLRETFVPAKVVVVVNEPERSTHESLVPWLAGKTCREGRTTAYVCENGACALPTTDAATFRRQLIGGGEPGFSREKTAAMIESPEKTR